MTEAAVMSWLDLNTPILPLRKFLSVYNSKISGFTELSMTKAGVVGKITVTLSKYVYHIEHNFPLSIALYTCIYLSPHTNSKQVI